MTLFVINYILKIFKYVMLLLTISTIFKLYLIVGLSSRKNIAIITVNDLLNLVVALFSIEVVIFAYVLVNKLVEVHVVVSLIFFDAVDSLYVAVVVNVILDVTFVVSKVSVSAIVKINQIKLKDQGFLVKPQLNTELPEFKQLH